MNQSFLRSLTQLRDYLARFRNRQFLLLDVVICLCCPVLALILRLDGEIAWEQNATGLIKVTALFLLIKLALFSAFGFYKRCWRYASIDELQQIGLLAIAVIILQTGLFSALYFYDPAIARLPRSLPILDGLLSILLIGSLRFSVRIAERLSQKWGRSLCWRDRVLIVGAGSAGVSLVQQMQRNPRLGFRPVAFVDDDPTKLNLNICRIPVVGDRYAIPLFVRSLHIRRVIIAMPSLPGQTIREILEICHSIGVPTSTLPSIDEIIHGRVSLSTVREVQIEDLLRREPIQMDVQRVSDFLKGKRVLITGAGGSIGSELCRQILKCDPAEIALIGHGENSVFLIQQELERSLSILQETSEQKVSTAKISAFIADIRRLSRLEHVFSQFKPEIIFHAAAHKHVPMMESNSPEAITNNVQGTKNLTDLALRFGVQAFVMISTDKAVNPTNVMGASKRVAEMLVLKAARSSPGRFVVVRFGNVLGSRGSVVPTFKQQILKGGPVTVTHPDMTRYFMTIPEAVQLVLQASVMSLGGEVLMLNMGDPVKIVDLAKTLIYLSGYEAGKDIDIVFTGLRPGEKLHEELFLPGEQYEPTDHEKLLIVKNASRFVPVNLDVMVRSLCRAASQNDANLIILLLKKLVPGYKPKYLQAIPALAHSNRANSALDAGQVNHPSLRPAERSVSSYPSPAVSINRTLI